MAPFLGPTPRVENNVGLSGEFRKAFSAWLLYFDTDLSVWKYVTQEANVSECCVGNPSLLMPYQLGTIAYRSRPPHFQQDSLRSATRSPGLD